MADLLSTLYDEAVRRAKVGVDDDARFRYLAWLLDPAASDTKKARIKAVLAWADTIWAQYRERRLLFKAGKRVPWFEDTPAPPYSFWDIADS